ncbi:MAG: hypothetical protein AB7U20_08625 [Planctomycetaceae bacterium]
MPVCECHPRNDASRTLLRGVGALAVAAFIGGACFRPAIGDEAAEPLARCAVQQLPVSGNSRMTAPVMGGQARPEGDVSANYRRTRSGDWDVPVTVDRDDPRIRVLLATPGGPLIMYLLVHVDGRSFPKATEEWIDGALASVTGERSAESDDGSPATEPSEPAENSESTDADPEVRQQPNALNRLRDYVGRSRIAVEPEEARWLLAQWVPGPTLIELRSNFAADRANFAPLWAALDEDGDRRVSAGEIGSAQVRLRARDANEDDWVDQKELSAGRSPIVRDWAPGSLVTLLTASTDWEGVRRQLAELYGPQTGRPAGPFTARIAQALAVADIRWISVNEARRLINVPPDVVVDVRLGTSDQSESTVAVMQLSEALSSYRGSLASAEQAISLHADGCVLELGAAQPSSDAAKNWNGQIAVGAVLDGAPLLRLVDTDNDHRLSLREIEALPGILSGLDVNGDGGLAAGEIPVPIRLGVTLGPHVHEMLRVPAAAVTGAFRSNVPAPEWFAGMDENKDQDLTPAEFLGTREQFDGLDQDHNGRISAREASLAGSNE